ncbi:MAG: hypothetical protein CM1200mP10_08540 [Candidatus Neomarinimicrobiota bacterium]|nr:MAG: hypothetical protein CM1200mP10_08540 [Candidatus Neomarinimicrobiota bacterium]
MIIFSSINVKDCVIDSIFEFESAETGNISRTWLFGFSKWQVTKIRGDPYSKWKRAAPFGVEAGKLKNFTNIPRFFAS